MNKIILSGIIITFIIMTAGCGQSGNKASENGSTPSVTTSVSINNQSASSTGSTQTVSSKVEIGITEQDLEDLKANIEKMEFDDISALSN
ncbi:MAG: hypothetical protein ABH832_02745 [bacterium]